MTNAEIARILGEIADLLDIGGAERFRVLSYRRGAEVVDNESRELAGLVAEGGVKSLKAIPGDRLGPGQEDRRAGGDGTIGVLR